MKFVKILTERYARGNEDYSSSGFYGEVTLNSFNNQSSNNYYKFFIQISIETSEGIQHIRSKRLKFQPRNATSKNQETTVRLKGASWKLRVKPTKKSDFLSVRMYQYKPLRQIAGKAKRFLLRVKQGKTVKRAYKPTFILLGKLPGKKKQVVFERLCRKTVQLQPQGDIRIYRSRTLHPEYDMSFGASIPGVPES